MTIAAGFNFDNGVLLCADTKHSGGFKIHASKIFAKTHKNGAVSALAYAGDMRYCRMGIQHIEDAISRLSKHGVGLPLLREQVEIEIEKLHTEHVYHHPDFRTGVLKVSYVGALWSPHDGLIAISTDDTGVMEFRGYDCLGSGNYLGHYMLRPDYSGAESTLKQIIVIAAGALMAVKDFDDGCGGTSEIITVSKAGEISPVHFLDIAHGENASRALVNAVRKLSFIISTVDVTDEQLELELKIFADTVRKTVKDDRYLRNLREAIKAVMPHGMPPAFREAVEKGVKQ